MTVSERPQGNFEERLLARLKAEVDERAADPARLEAADAGGSRPPWRRRGPRLALVGGIAIAALAARAVEPQAGGGETVKIFSLQEAGALEAALKRVGIKAQVSWLPSGTVCREPHFKRSVAHLPGGGTFGGLSVEGPIGSGFTFEIGPTRLFRKRISNHHWQERHKDVPVGNVNLDPEAFGPDQTVVLTGAPLPYLGDPEGGLEASFAVAEGTVRPCVPVPGPKNHYALRADEEQARHDPKFREATTSGG